MTDQRRLPTRSLTVLVTALVIALFAGPAAALDGDKVVVRYSMKSEDGGQWIRTIFPSMLGLGDMRVIVDPCVPQTRGYQVLVTDSLSFTIEFTADMGGNIVEGPVDLINARFKTHFRTKLGGGHVQVVDPEDPKNILIAGNGSSVDTRVDSFQTRTARGALTLNGTCDTLQNWDYITWERETENSWETLNDCADFDSPWPNDACWSDCLGSAGLCNLAASKETPWPRVEPTSPTPPHETPPLTEPDLRGRLPLMSVLTNSTLGDEVHGDNCTPLGYDPPIPPLAAFKDDPEGLEPTDPGYTGFAPLLAEIDDLRENEDSQATTTATWYAVEVERAFCTGSKGDAALCTATGPPAPAPVVCPEPGSTLMAGAAFAALFGLRRRTRRA